MHVRVMRTAAAASVDTHMAGTRPANQAVLNRGHRLEAHIAAATQNFVARRVFQPHSQQHSLNTASQLPTRGHDLDAHIAAVVLYDDAAAARLVLQAQHARAAGQEVPRVVKGVEPNQVCRTWRGRTR